MENDRVYKVYKMVKVYTIPDCRFCGHRLQPTEECPYIQLYAVTENGREVLHCRGFRDDPDAG